MRLLLQLKSKRTVSQDKINNSKYYTGMHGWIYKKLKGTKYEKIHSKKAFKPFCFGNLYPVNDQRIEEGEKYKVLISSPLPDFIQTLFFNLNEGETVNLGEYSFGLEEFTVKIIKLKKDSKIENLTLINLTKHKDEKIIALKFGEKKYLDSLNKNLIRKYNFFNKTQINENFNLFENVDIFPYENRKEVAIQIFFHNKNKNDFFTIIGSKLVFKFNKISDEQLKIFQYCFDLGFGERTSYGMGFMMERWGR